MPTKTESESSLQITMPVTPPLKTGKKEKTERTETLWGHLLKNICKGSVMGATEVTFTHPLWVIKTRLQNREKFTLNPRILYRGISLNLASTLPITAIQVSSTMSLQKLFGSKNSPEDRLSKFQSLSCCFLGGALSALVSTPSELLMSHVNENCGFAGTIKNFKNHHGLKSFYTGFIGTAMRDGIYTMGFMGLPKMMERGINHLLPEYENLSSILSGPISGLSAAALSHPFDSIKTRQQKLIRQSQSSFLSTTKDIVKNEGFFVLFRGFTPRALMVTTAISVMDTASKKWDEKVSRKAFW